MSNVIGVNLETIAKGFSGAILFDGEGSVEIIETEGYFTFWESFKPIGDGSNPEYKTIHENLSIQDEELSNFNLYNLIYLKADRDTFGKYKKVKKILEDIDSLEPQQRERLIHILNNENSISK